MPAASAPGRPSRAPSRVPPRAGSARSRSRTRRAVSRLERRAHRVELRLREDLDRLGLAEAGRAQRYLGAADSSPVTRRASPRHARSSPRAIEQERRLPAPCSTADIEDARGRVRGHRQARWSSSGTRRSRCADSSATTDPIGTGFSATAAARPVVEPWSSSTELPKAPQPGRLAEPASGGRAAFGAGELDGDLRHEWLSLGVASDASVTKVRRLA